MKRKDKYFTFTIKIKKKTVAICSFIVLIALILSISALVIFKKPDNKFKDVKIYLSPSNQSANFYATGDTNEMEQCDKIAEKTAELLKKRGFQVKLGKSGDSIENRCDESNKFGADMHIPIHTNALDGTYTGGTHVYVYGEEAKPVAQYFYDELAPISPGTDDRLKYQPELYELYQTNATSVYLECEFHDTKEGAKWIINNTDEIAEAISDSVYNYYSENMPK